MREIELEGVGVVTGYAKFTISEIDFHLRGGHIMGLIGRSGSGKSTVIKTLIGLKSPMEGKITAYVNGKPTNMNELIGYSPQENSLFPYLSLQENIFTFGKLYHSDNYTIQKRMNLLLSRLDLTDHKDKRITKLSGGMQKRADLAVTLIHDPDIIILDEPFTGLDISLQKFIWDFLKDLAANGKLIIISSHLLEDIQRNCNRFCLIEKGIFYNTSQIFQTLKRSRIISLEQYLQNLFSSEKPK